MMLGNEGSEIWGRRALKVDKEFVQQVKQATMEKGEGYWRKIDVILKSA